MAPESDQAEELEVTELSSASLCTIAWLTAAENRFVGFPPIRSQG
jgi:hypothetical protein